MISKTTYYEKINENHTLETFDLAEKKLQETGIRKIVLASTTGRTALKAMEYFEGKGIQLIVIPHQYGFSSEENRFPRDTVETLIEHDIKSILELCFFILKKYMLPLFQPSLPTFCVVSARESRYVLK